MLADPLRSSTVPVPASAPASASTTSSKHQPSAAVPPHRIPRLREVALLTGSVWVGEGGAGEIVTRRGIALKDPGMPGVNSLADVLTARDVALVPSLVLVFHQAITAGKIERGPSGTVRVAPAFWADIQSLDLVLCPRCHLVHHEVGMSCWHCNERT